MRWRPDARGRHRQRGLRTDVGVVASSLVVGFTGVPRFERIVPMTLPVVRKGCQWLSGRADADVTANDSARNRWRSLSVTFDGEPVGTKLHSGLKSWDAGRRTALVSSRNRIVSNTARILTYGPVRWTAAGGFDFYNGSATREPFQRTAVGCRPGERLPGRRYAITHRRLQHGNFGALCAVRRFRSTAP